MSELLALDMATLPPPDVRARAVRVSAGLPPADFEGLRLDEEHLPHVTLTQQFVRAADLDRVFGRVDEVLRGRLPLTIRVTGAARTPGNTVWMAVEQTKDLAELHDRLMEALREFERVGGAEAFADGEARLADIAWVAGYRMTSSVLSYRPHITLGHASEPPPVEPFTFEATIIAACHLGRFCTCRRILRSWTLR
ncbi:MAG: 2'-5' RNA ligase family protein [Acidobacteria bacterium]|nr:2'-5' RNA ligase family protein [Acidobacteriota bacterium]